MKTFRLLLVALFVSCSGLPIEVPTDGGEDAGPIDSGMTDAGTPDAGPTDAGMTDAGPTDAGPPDAGPTDAGPPDAGPTDAGPTDAGPIDAGTPARLTLTPSELVFSGVRATAIPSQKFTATNVGGMPLQLTSATTAAPFTVVATPALPATLAPGQSATLAVTFAPNATALGYLAGRLTLATSVGAADAGLYGLATKGEQGANEPAFASCVAALGYGIDVGGTGLILGTGAAPIGDEVIHPLFHKADAGPVTLRPVARYSPNETLPFGWYVQTADGGVSTSLVGTIALGQEQTLNPQTTPDSGTTFDPGNATFGLFVSSNTFNRNTYTQDARNTGPTVHASRVYPLKDRQGQLVPHAYLIGFEDAANGDYQDYVFLLTNVD